MFLRRLVCLMAPAVFCVFPALLYAAPPLPDVVDIQGTPCPERTFPPGYSIEFLDQIAYASGNLADPRVEFRTRYYIRGVDGDVEGTCQWWVEYGKPESTIEYWSDKAKRTRQAADLINLPNIVHGLVKSSAQRIITLAPYLTSSGESQAIDYVSNGIAAAAIFGAVFASGPIGPAVFGTFGLVSAGASYMASDYQRIADDPPDANYQQLYQYSDTAPQVEFEVASEFNAYINAMLEKQLLAAETLDGVLTSLERFYGAGEARDAEWALAQLEAAHYYAEVHDQAFHDLGVFIEHLPSVLQAIGVDDFSVSPADILALKQEISEHGIDQEAVSLLVGAGFPGDIGQQITSYALNLDENAVTDGLTLYSAYEAYGQSMQTAGFPDPELPPIPNSPGDRDGDGINDDDDVFPDDPTEWSDFDGDGVGDNADTDDDNDGQSDQHELICESDPLDAGSLAADFDSDGLPDCIDQDDDNDLVVDEIDICPATRIPEVAPTSSDGLQKNRWALMSATGEFTQAPPQANFLYRISAEMTRGCSCAQIVDVTGIGHNHKERGCSTSVMLEWINQ